MALNLKRPNGTEDITPANIHKWYTVEQVARSVAQSYGFREIRIPTFENTELFQRSVGETTDVVQKEMYTVMAKETKFTLRPEGTAGTIRAMLQNGLLNEALPQKVFYLLSCFRHERPQAGRLREFHQFGLEMAGSAEPAADAEVISLAKAVLDTLGLKGIQLYINSIGCPTCRAEYHKALRAYFEARKDQLCDTCLSRLEKNPMRILDCKSPICGELGKDAPVILDYLCEDCKTHFEKLQGYLKAMGIDFSINPKIVRGLDYYTKTVFEFVTTDIGAQGTVCGGGRYDNLVEEIGGKPTGAVGFGLGIERLIMILEKQHGAITETPERDVYIGSMGEKGLLKAQSLTYGLRKAGIQADCDTVERSVKAQMKYANKIGAKYSVILGDSELESGRAELKDMANSEKSEVALADLPAILKEKCGK